MSIFSPKKRGDGWGFGQKAHFFGFLIPSLKTICPTVAPRCSHSQFSFKKLLRPTVAKCVHLQDRGCDKIFSTPITIYGFSPVWVNMCLTWEVGFGNIYSQNSQFSLWKWLRPSVAKFMNLQHSGCDKIFSALITKHMFLRRFLVCWFNILFSTRFTIFALVNMPLLWPHCGKICASSGQGIR